jgi:hypothetical protein
MALVDKVKNQAAQLAQKAQEAGKVGQAKIEEIQARRQADAALRELGRLVYHQVKAGGTLAMTPEMESRVAEVSVYEDEHGPLSTTSDD